VQGGLFHLQRFVNSLKRSWVELALAVVLLSAAALRLHNVNWDDLQHVHPDERWISMVASDIAWPESFKDILDSRKSTLNPLWIPRDNTRRNYAYGHLPLYLLVFVANLVTRFAPLARYLSAYPDLAEAVSDLALMADYSHINLVGRVLSAFADLGIIYLVFLLGKHVYDKRVGLLGATFVTFTVMQIQLAHFCAFDVVTTFFTVLTVYGAVRLAQRGDCFSAIVAGAAAGLAVASKFSAMPIFLTLVVACGVRVFTSGARLGRRPLPIADDQQSEAMGRGLTDNFRRALGLLVISLLAAAVAFAVTSPFAILDLKAYLDQVKQQGGMVRGTNDWPFTRQYRGTLPYIYHIEQQLRWGMGWPLGLVAFAGFAYFLWRAVRRRCRGEEWVILSWVVPYFLITGSFMVKFMRYMLPITPFLSLMGAEMLFTMHDAGRKMHNARLSSLLPSPFSTLHLSSFILYLVSGIVIISSIFYSLAFVSIYSRLHTWLEASRWIYAHVPDGSTIATEHWDDDLPKLLPEAGQNSGAHGYHHLSLPMYEPDTSDKYALLKDILSQADYIILASNRLYRTIPRLPQRYPISTRYYELLFAEELGFRLEKVFTSHPGLLGWTIVDDAADESFTVYDHPKPLIFKKEQELSDEESDALFAEALSVEPEWELGPGLFSRTLGLLSRAKVNPPPEEEGESKTLLLDRPVDELPVIDDFHWNKVASRNHLLAVVVWWVVIELLGWIGWPLAFVVFPNLRDRGYILAKGLSLLFIAYLTWLAASLRLLTNSLLTILLALFLLLVLSLSLFFRNKAQVIAFCRSQFRLIVINELLFAFAFLIFVGIRLLNPDLWQPWTGGEKMMEFAFLNAILKSPYFPPYDPYFAGGYINYYYYGQFIVSIMIKLTGIQPSVAFNLAVPMLFALTVGGAFCVVYNLVPDCKSGGSSGDKEDKVRDSRFVDSRPIYWGLLGSLFVAVLGNLDGMTQMVKKIGNLGGSNFHSTIPGLEGLVRLMPGLAKVLSGHSLPAFDYWSPTRVIPFTINEFPYFSFLFADLHPHMIGIPFTILFLALAFNVVAGGRGRWGDALERLISWAVIPLCLGALAVINTWDVPTYLGIISCAFLLRQWKRGRTNLLRVVGFAILVGGLSLVLYWPFFKHYKALHVGVGLVKGRTDFRAFITIWGFFLFVLITFLITELLRQRSRLSILRFLRLMAKRWEELPHLSELYGALVREQTTGYLFGVYALGAVLVVVAALAWLRYWVLVLLVPPLILAALLLLYREASPEELFTYFLVFTGFLVLVGCEAFYLKDFLQGGDHRRMNTLFKFYIQVWVLLGLAAAAALPRLWASLGRWRSGRPFDPSTELPSTMLGTGRAGFSQDRLRYVWMGLFFILLFSACVYPFWGTPQRVADRFPGQRPPIGTLDGMAYMTVGSYAWPDSNNLIELKYDYKAIQWLLANVRGTPAIAEAALPYYREGGSRVASYTGLPSLLGVQHEGEQRYGWQVGQRDGEVRDFYMTGDIGRALDLIRNLDISYIYVGKLERTVYDPIGLAKFDRMVEEGYLTVPYSNEEVKIYKVIGNRG
jgi:YYY domain-containing protein